jgi:hypothetical protein
MKIPPIEITVTTPDFTVARTHADKANQHAERAVFHAVQCGLELLRIRSAHPELRGGDQNRQRDGFALPWEEIVKNEVGISEPTARRWMMQARGALVAVDVQPEQWLALPDNKRAVAMAKVEKLAEKYPTQSDFMDALYGKKAPGEKPAPRMGADKAKPGLRVRDNPRARCNRSMAQITMDDALLAMDVFFKDRHHLEISADERALMIAALTEWNLMLKRIKD